MWHLFLAKRRISAKNLGKFDLIIDLQTKLRNTLILKKFHMYYFILKL